MFPCVHSTVHHSNTRDSSITYYRNSLTSCSCDRGYCIPLLLSVRLAKLKTFTSHSLHFMYVHTYIRMYIHQHSTYVCMHHCTSFVGSFTVLTLGRAKDELFLRIPRFSFMPLISPGTLSVSNGGNLTMLVASTLNCG